MSERALRAVLGVVAALVVAYLAISWLGGEEQQTAGDDPVSAVLAGVGDSTVRAIRIRRPDLSVDLVRRAEGWRANEFEADTAAISHLLETVRGASVAEIVSRNPENHPSLGVTLDSAWRVRFVAESDSTPPLLVGGDGPYDPSAYVRLEGDDRVYVLRGSLRSVLGGEMVQWRDKTVAELDTARIRHVLVRRQEGLYRLRREGDGWTVDSLPADTAAVRHLLGGLRQMEGFAFASDTGAFTMPTREVVALAAPGDTLGWIRATPSKAGGSWLVRSHRGHGAVYRVGHGPVNRVSPPRDSLTPGSGG